MKITILCSDREHPVNKYLEDWISRNSASHDLTLARRKDDIPGGEILFLISCSEIVKRHDLAKYKNSLVLHASDLPKGRGWSPHIWEILNGEETITLSLLEAGDKVDSGRIWKKMKLFIPRHALWNEINDCLFRAEIELMDFAVNNYQHIQPTEQDDTIPPTYFPKRSPENSMLNPGSSLEVQFDQIRVCDPNRFPAYFHLHGHRYKLILEKMDL